MGDDELGGLIGRDPWDLAFERTQAIGEVAVACGLTGPGGFTQTVLGLEALPAAHWERAAWPPRMREEARAREAAEREAERLRAEAEAAERKHCNELARLRGELGDLELAAGDLEVERERLSNENRELAERLSIETGVRHRAEEMVSHEAELRQAAEDELEAERKTREKAEEAARREAELRQRAAARLEHDAQAAQDELEAERKRRENAEERAENAAAGCRRAEQELLELRVAVDVAETRRAVAEETACRLAAAGNEAGVDDAEWERLAARVAAVVKEADPSLNGSGTGNGSGARNGSSPRVRNGTPRPSATQIAARVRAADERAHCVAE
jgi:hypothetical protein